MIRKIIKKIKSVFCKHVYHPESWRWTKDYITNSFVIKTTFVCSKCGKKYQKTVSKDMEWVYELPAIKKLERR